jgi:hypothetical protein
MDCSDGLFMNFAGWRVRLHPAVQAQRMPRIWDEPVMGVYRWPGWLSDALSCCTAVERLAS